MAIRHAAATSEHHRTRPIVRMRRAQTCEDAESPELGRRVRMRETLYHDRERLFRHALHHVPIFEGRAGGPLRIEQGRFDGGACAVESVFEVEALHVPAGKERMSD